MAYQIVHVVHFDGELIGTSSRSVLPNVYETVALPRKLAARMTDDDMVVCHVMVAGDATMRPVPAPHRDADADEIPW